LERLKTLGSAALTNREISKALHIPISTVKRHTLVLLQSGYLSREFVQEGNSFRYTLHDEQHYQDLQSSIASILDQTLERLTGSTGAQQVIEPPKRKSNKAKSR
jgi:DNA-binding IclR family transcriptional regulator